MEKAGVTGKAYRDRMNWENINYAQYHGCKPYDIPRMLPCSRLEVKRWIGFGEAAHCPAGLRRSTGIHFWLLDSYFRCIWEQPKRYRDFLMQFGAVCSPEFSVYDAFPAALRIYNMYRNAWLARYWAESGINVVPSVLWSYAGDSEYIWDIYPRDSILALSTVGCMRGKAARDWTERGTAEMEEKLNPRMVLLHGIPPQSLTVPYFQIEPFTTGMHRRISKGGG